MFGDLESLGATSDRRIKITCDGLLKGQEIDVERAWLKERVGKRVIEAA